MIRVASNWVDGFLKAFYIAKKDAKVYYFKAPNFTYGLLMPVSLFFAFSIAGQVNPNLIVSGLTSLAILFGTTSIEAVAVVLERQNGTFERLIVAPVSFYTIILGKALAGLFFGLILAIGILVPLSILSGTALANPLLFFIAVAFSSLTFSGLGVLVSVYAKWVPEAQMLDNFIRLPMAFLSGAFVPLELMPSQLQVVARFLPLTYSVEAFRASVNNSVSINAYLLDIVALTAFSLALFLIAAKVLQKKID
jgi:ABC-2 type transport system permease protein